MLLTVTPSNGSSSFALRAQWSRFEFIYFLKKKLALNFKGKEAKTMLLRLYMKKDELARGQNLVGLRLYFSSGGNNFISLSLCWKDNTQPFLLNCSLFFNANELEKFIFDRQAWLGIFLKYLSLNLSFESVFDWSCILISAESKGIWCLGQQICLLVV